MRTLARTRTAVLMAASIAAFGGCGGGGATARPSSASIPASQPAPASNAPSANAVARSVVPSAGPTQAPCATPIVGAVDPAGIVPSTANIFGAGHKIPPAPGGGGRGTLPPLRPLPAGPARILTVTSARGCVNPIRGQAPWNGPAGDGVGKTDVTSFEGLSGIVHEGNGMFLVGVFLTDTEPADPAPERLDFTANEAFTSLSPRIAQVFFIGDGSARRFVVPAKATRLFLGFADAAGYRGAPGWYGNNVGELHVTVAIAST